MSITGSVKRLLWRILPLESYLRVLSCAFFTGLRLGLERRSAAYRYPRFLKNLVRRGDVVLDIGANLGYYCRIMARLVGPEGKVWAIEPVKPILGVLRRNLRGLSNVEIVPYALGRQNHTISMRNDTVSLAGYMGTGRNYISENRSEADRQQSGMEFEAEMRRGSELFGDLERLDFIKCDVEGYEAVVIGEMEPVIRRHMPVILMETEGPHRREMIELLRGWGYAGYALSAIPSDQFKWDRHQGHPRPTPRGI